MVAWQRQEGRSYRGWMVDGRWAPAASRCCMPTAVQSLVLVVLCSLLQPGPSAAFSVAQLFRSTKVASSEQLLECVNDKFDSTQGTTWTSAMSDQPSYFKAMAAWWSKKPMQIPLTVVTQLSANRLTQLLAQCKSWPGPLSAAVYQPINQPNATPLTAKNALLIKQTIKSLSDFHQSVEMDQTACRLDIVYVYEVYTEKRATILYPVNQLRNLARLQARTELIGLMDVDMLVSSKLARSLHDPVRAAVMSETCKNKTVYVTPAFETYGDPTEAAQLADQLVRQSKTYLVRSVDTGIIAPFDAVRFPIGHNTTNFKRWYSTDTQYQVGYSARYEPWIIVNRKAVPWHDVRFRGYGQNKIVHIGHVNASGFAFVVHPTGFIIHRAHELTAARTQLVEDMKLDSQLKREKKRVSNDTIYGHSARLWEDAKLRMTRGTFEPVIDKATQHCWSKLSWWQ